VDWWGQFSDVERGGDFTDGLFAAPAFAQQAGQKTFSSPEEASKALFAAAKSNDERPCSSWLGPEGKEIISSGTKPMTAQSRAEFAKRYEEMSRLVKEPDAASPCISGAQLALPDPLLKRALCGISIQPRGAGDSLPPHRPQRGLGHPR